MPSLEHQASSQRIPVELAGGAVSVSVNGAVIDLGATSPRLGGTSSVGEGAIGGISSELGARATDKCVPSCDGMTCVRSHQ